MPSSISEPSIITLEKPERIARHADAGRLAVVLVHDDRDVRIGLDRGLDQVPQERLAGVLYARPPSPA